MKCSFEKDDSRGFQSRLFGSRSDPQHNPYWSCLPATMGALTHDIDAFEAGSSIGMMIKGGNLKTKKDCLAVVGCGTVHLVIAYFSLAIRWKSFSGGKNSVRYPIRTFPGGYGVFTQ